MIDAGTNILIVAGTVFMLPTLLAVPITQAILRRMERVAEIATHDTERISGEDKVGAAQILKGVRATVALAPAAAEGIVRIDYAKLHTEGDGERFVSLHDGLARAAATTHMVARILRWLARPYSLSRLSAAWSAWALLAKHSDESGRIKSMDLFRGYMTRYPPEKNPEPLTVATV